MPHSHARATEKVDGSGVEYVFDRELVIRRHHIWSGSFPAVRLLAKLEPLLYANIGIGYSISSPLDTVSERR